MITAHILDSAVLERIRLVLNRPEVIGAEVARLRRDDPTKANREAVELRKSEIDGRRKNLVRRVATIDDDDVAGLLMAEMAALGKQLAALADESKALNAERTSWEASQSRLDDLEDWCRIVAQNIDLLDYAGRRLALDALGVEVRVWSTDHTPRYEIKMIPDAAPVLVNGPRTGADVAPGAAHVDGYIRRGCARRDARRADRL